MAASPAAAPVASVRDVSLRYGKTTALASVTLDIPAGCVVGLIGPDGVGKSSLLSLIAGARALQSGHIDVLGGDMASAAHRRSVCPRIAYMPQGLGKNLYPTLSVFENIDFFARLFGQAARRTRAPHRRAGAEHRPCPLRRPPGRQAVRRHETEARTLLRTGPRSRSADHGRADHRHRSAVAPAILGIDRSHPHGPSGHERTGGDRRHGRSRGIRLAGGHGRRAAYLASGTVQDLLVHTGTDHARSGLHRPAAGGAAAPPPRHRQSRRAGTAIPTSPSRRRI